MNTRTSILAVSLLTAVAPLAFAADPAPAADVATAGYHLKNRSEFAAQQTRAPFWPIGWSPTEKNAGPTAGGNASFALNPDHFTVTSILIGAQSLAVINGRGYLEGENLRTPRVRRSADGNAEASKAAPAWPAGLKIRVQRITDGEVTLQAGTQSINVPLRRPQLAEHHSTPDEEILGQDETN